MPSIRKKSFAAEQLALRKQKKINPVIWVLAVVVVVALVVGGYVMYQRSVQKQVETEQIKSIAVLPFRDMSQERDQDYFCEGIAEEIINTLTKIDGLRVIARTSSFEFKGRENAISEIGGKLNVETVLEGSVRKEGDQLRITAQLIKVDDESHLWSDQYDRTMESAFAIQSEIAQAVVGELKGELLGHEKSMITKRPTNNKEAYELYLRGKYHLDISFMSELEIGENITKAFDYFDRAIELDPGFALAYAGCAGSWASQTYVNAWYANKALEIDDTIAEAYLALANHSSTTEWDFKTADEMYRRAIACNPGFARSHWRYADFLLMMGQLEEALGEVTISIELDPLQVFTYSTATGIYMEMEMYDKVLEMYSKALEIDPNIVWARIHRARLYSKNGQNGKALEEMKIAAEVNKFDDYEFESDPRTGYFYAKMGEHEKAREVIRTIEQSKQQNINTDIAMVYAGLNETDRIYEYLEKALEKRERGVIWVKTSFEFDSIRSDPRYEPFIRKIFEESIQKVDIPEMKTPVHVDPGVFDAYTGRYYSPMQDRFNTVKNEQGRLYVETDNRALIRLYPLSETEFFLKNIPESKFVFEKDAHDKVTQCVVDLPWGKDINKKIE